MTELMVAREIELPVGRCLGIDVGGTASRAVLAVDGALAGEWRLPAGNLALDTTLLVKELEPLCSALRPERIAIGVPGVRRAEAGRRRELEAMLAPHAPGGVVVRSDAEIAHLGALGGEAGTVVCAGTGSVAVSGDAAAQVFVGGHGYLVDDRGSAYGIARDALALALHRRDLGEPCGLADCLERAAGTTLDDLVESVYRTPTDRTVIASLAPAVTAAGDPDAQRITRDAADSLIRLAHDAARQEGARLSFAGGVFESVAVRGAFIAGTRAQLPLAPPEIGALVALRLA